MSTYISNSVKLMTIRKDPIIPCSLITRAIVRALQIIYALKFHVKRMTHFLLFHIYIHKSKLYNLDRGKELTYNMHLHVFITFLFI